MSNSSTDSGNNKATGDQTPFDRPSSTIPEAVAGGKDQRTYFRRGIDFMYGEDANLHRVVPPQVGEKHINELLGRHIYYPWDEQMTEEHPCYIPNRTFGVCMHDPLKESLELHMKHVTCFHPEKKALMTCLVKYQRAQRKITEETAGGASEATTANESVVARSGPNK